MSKIVLKDAVITVNNVNLSDHFSEVEIESTADEVEFTSFGATFREFGQGLKDATITCTAFQDTAVAQIHATVEPFYSSGATVEVTVKQSSATTSATNPKAVMSARVFSYNFLSGSVGDASTTPITFRNASSSSGITYATA